MVRIISNTLIVRNFAQFVDSECRKPNTIFGAKTKTVARNQQFLRVLPILNPKTTRQKGPKGSKFAFPIPLRMRIAPQFARIAIGDSRFPRGARAKRTCIVDHDARRRAPIGVCTRAARSVLCRAREPLAPVRAAYAARDEPSPRAAALHAAPLPTCTRVPISSGHPPCV
jgi:hypothetical protein